MDTVVQALELLAPHAAFLGFMVVHSLLAHTLSSSVFTRRAALYSKPRWLYVWGRKLLPLFPLANAAAIALVWRQPEPSVVTYTQRAIYFGAAGSLALVAYDIMVAILRKEGIPLRLEDGQSVPPACSETSPEPPQ